MDTGASEVRVIAALHPLRFDTVEVMFPAGLTVVEIMGRDDLPALVWSDGELIDCEHWHEVIPHRHCFIKRLPSDRNALRMIAFIVVAVVAAWTGNWAAAQGFSKLAVAGFQVGVGVAGALIVNTLIPPVLPDVGGTGGQQSLAAITGQSNQVAPWAPIPKIYGTPTYYPPIPMTGLPYTELVGDDQYLRLLLVLGYGPLSIGGVTAGAGQPLITHNTVLTGNPIKIGGTSIDQFDDVEFQIGDPDDVTLFTSSVVETAVNVAINRVGADPSSSNQTINDGNTVTQTTEVDTDEVSIEVFSPAMFTMTDGGRTRFARVTFEVHRSPAGAGTWTSMGTFTISSSERKPVRRGARYVMPATGQYDIRLTRVSSFYQARHEFFNDVTWTVMRSIKRDVRPFDVDNTVVMALRIRATDQLGGRVDRLSVTASGMIPTWNGTAWTAPAITRNPAWIYADIISGNATKSAQDRAKLDTTALASWATFCADENLYFDAAIDAEGTVFDRAKEVAAMGFASWHVTDDAKFSVVRDVAATSRMVVTPRNSAGFQVDHVFHRLPHALRVTFTDPVTWEPTERIVYDDGYNAGNATRYEQLQTVGVSSADHAWKFGRYHLAQLRLRPETYSWTQDIQHLAYQRGDTVEIANDVMLVGLGWGRIKGITVDGNGDALTATVDDVLEMENAVSYALRIQKSDGTIVTAAITTVVGGVQTVTFSAPVAGIAAGDHFAWGVAGSEKIGAKIIRIEPQTDFKASITAVPAADNIFDAWTGGIPAWDPVMTGPADPSLITPAVPTLDQVVSQNISSGDGSGTFRSRLAISFTMAEPLQGVIVEARIRVVATISAVDYEGPWVYLPGVDSQSGIIFADVEDDLVYEAQVRSRRGDRVSPWTASVEETVGAINSRLVTTATSYNRSNIWNRSSGTWSPADTTVDGTVTFRSPEGEIATRTIRATLTTGTGTIAVAAQANTGEDTTWTSSGGGTRSVGVAVTHTQSGVVETLNFASVGETTPTTVTATGSNTPPALTAAATINRGGAQTTIVVDASIANANTVSLGATPFPVTLTLRRGGSGGTVIATWTLGGYHFQVASPGEDVVYGNGTYTYIDTDTGTGSTEYHVTLATNNNNYNEYLTVTATQTYYT